MKLTLGKIVETLEVKIHERAEVLFQNHQEQIYKRTDRLFSGLLAFEWIASIIIALTISPRAWSGEVDSMHPHVYIAVFFGGLITVFPIMLAILYPGKTQTRYVIAISQMLWSSIFIHLTGGRIETHFHIFGSLAFLAFYRDWKLLIPATLIAVLDHYVRGAYWPESIFGITRVDSWRWLEHSGWILFEVGFLSAACLQSKREMRSIADRTAQLEFTKQKIEATVVQRTSELEASQAALRMANRSKDAFLANMSHEIRTPLNGIIGVGALLELTPLNEKQAKYVQTIVQSGGILLSIISNVLDYSKIIAEKMELRLYRFNLKDLVEETVNVIMSVADQKNIHLYYTIEEGVPEVLIGDNFRLKQILINLLNNAVKFTDRGEVRLMIEREKKQSIKDDVLPLKITVEDTGIGIPEKKLNMIFQPFTQVDNSTTRRFGGTGLGLSIVVKLLDLMHGTIAVDSVEGVGSKFVVRLAMEVVQKEVTNNIPIASQAKSSEGLKSLGHLNVLVAEDNMSNQFVIEELLKDLGCKVHLASNGQEAINKLSQEPINICLMDIHMPMMDGIAATLKIRQSTYKKLPIIALSASVFEADRQKCFEAGVDDFIEKPVQSEVLKKVLEKWS